MRSRSNSGVRLDGYARLVQRTILCHQVRGIRAEPSRAEPGGSRWGGAPRPLKGRRGGDLGLPRCVTRIGSGSGVQSEPPGRSKAGSSGGPREMLRDGFLGWSSEPGQA